MPPKPWLAQKAAATPRLPSDRAAGRIPNSERRRLQLNLALHPAGRRLNLPPVLFAQRGLQKSRLGVVKTITGGVLARRAIHQHLLQFLDRAGVEQREFAVLEPGVALAGKEQSLNLATARALAARRVVTHVQIEPLFAGGVI